MLSKKIRGQFPDQTQEKTEEEIGRVRWVGVSLRFPIGVLGEPYMYHDLDEFTRMWGFYLEELGQGCRIIWQGFY